MILGDVLVGARVAGRVVVDALCSFFTSVIESMSVGRFFILPFFGLVSCELDEQQKATIER